MLYFKTITLPELTQDQLERALRKLSLKKGRPLDFDISSMNIGTDKLFFGYEGKNSLTFTRIRTSFERLIPKLIIKLSRDGLSCNYSIRLGVFTTLWVLMFGVFILLALFNLSIGSIQLSGIFPLLIVNGIVVGAFYLEYRLTTSRVEKAVKRYFEAITV